MRGGPRPGEAGRWTNRKIEALERVGKIGCVGAQEYALDVGKLTLNRICVGIADVIRQLRAEHEAEGG